MSGRVWRARSRDSCGRAACRPGIRRRPGSGPGPGDRDRLRRGAAAGAPGGDPWRPGPPGAGRRRDGGGGGGQGGGGARPDREAAAREARDGPGDGGAEAGTPPGAAPAAGPAHARHAAVPGRTGGIGPNGAPLPGAELSCRDLRNRRGPASPAGPGPVPWPGGAVDHDRGISKAGSPMLRKHLARMAWRWLHHHPDSALSGWSVQYVSARDGRPGRRGIVALPGKLLVAPVRFATTGLAHGGAVLSKAPA